MSKEFYPGPYQLKELVNLIMELKQKGSSLKMDWGEDIDCWEVAFITSGERFCATGTHLLFALQTVQHLAKEKAKEAANV